MKVVKHTLPLGPGSSRFLTASSSGRTLPVRSQPAERHDDWYAGHWTLGKRILDLICLAVALPGVMLLMLLLALWIKLVSPGPVFFRQERVGLGRKRFVCLKFRTMQVGADTRVHRHYLEELVRSDAPMLKMDTHGDPRLIPGGAFLRAAGLDELPQLINVLRGEMSLVGPRPCTPYELENYQPWQYARFDTLPGLTGLWQVSGKNKTTFKEMIQLDICYVRTKSLWFDLRIMTATFLTLVGQVREARAGSRSDNRSARTPASN